MRSVYRRIVLWVVFAVCSPAVASAQIAVSDFANDADGWVTVANKHAPVIHEPGMISQFDIHYGLMAFKAPSKYKGNISAAYGGTFSFEMMTSAPTYAPSTPKVRISGNTPMGSLTIKIPLQTPALPGVFYAYSIALDESESWNLVGHKRAPTGEEIQAILANVTDVRIVGDTLASSDEMFAIRNVRLDPKPVAPTGGLKVFIMAGQSNMAGCDDVRNVDPMWASANEDVMMYWGNELTPGFQALTTGTSGASCSSQSPQFYYGPELSFGSDMSALYPDEQIIIIKFAVGGTDMFSQWTTPWRLYPDGGPLWIELQQKVSDALNELTAMGYEYDIKGFLWMQGESDADKRYRARYYNRNLSRFIASMRLFTGLPNMPFILGRVRDAGQPYAQMVRDAQVDVAMNIPNVYWIDTDDLGVLPDGIHYDEPSMIELGHRFADIVSALP